MFIAPEAEVLVVDESTMNLTVIRELLRATRVFVITSDSREDCLEKVKYGSFDLVILDAMMASDVLTRIHEMKPGLPVTRIVFPFRSICSLSCFPRSL